MATSNLRIDVAKTTRRQSFMAQPFKSPSGMFYIRRKVPDGLRAIVGHEYKRSLKTRDPKEAKRLFAMEWENSESLFVMARAQQAGAATLTQRDMRVLAERWYDTELAKMEASGDFAAWLASHGPVVQEQGDQGHECTPMHSLREALNSDPEDEALVDTLGLVHTALREHNIPMPAQGTPELERLLGVFREQWLKLSDTALSRYKGNWTPTPSVLATEPLSFEVKPPSADVGKGLLAVVEEYAQDRLLNDGNTRAVERSIKASRALVAEFIDLCGDLPVSKITRDVVRKYRADIATLPAKGDGIRKLSARQKIEKAKLEALPLIEAATIRNKVRGISAILSYALRMQLITENPIIAGGMGNAAAKAAAKRQAGKRARNFYDDAELSQIFNSPVFKEGWTPPRADFGKAWYWLPLLMYYTGARREELAQLAVRDVKADLPEVGPYLSILNTEGEDDGARGVKNEGSRRSIPVHPDLIALGFIDYVHSLSQDGQLFPMLKPNPAGYYGANFGKRWAEYLRHVVALNSPANPSHGFRHTFKTLCRKVAIPEDVSDAITGHTGTRSVARDYGVMPLSRMAEELRKYPSAPISTLNKD
ncbi:site-specific integrase [Rhodoferax sp.]|uniref:site-specific integrase n=1 Tax=Rhodoferax sp. TaxID=50421 RepID=UPI00262BFF65|nr:site-specific integrase [Rhodoferax sp.]MDD3937973.1 site-specific integrase [Rhodoferax sp.]